MRTFLAGGTDDDGVEPKDVGLSELAQMHPLCQKNVTTYAGQTATMHCCLARVERDLSVSRTGQRTLLLEECQLHASGPEHSMCRCRRSVLCGLFLSINSVFLFAGMSQINGCKK